MRMIKMKKISFFLLLVTTLLSLGWLALGYEQIRPGLKTDLDRCIDQCREEEEELSGLFSCAARCERKYSQPGGGSRREREREQREREPERQEEEGERERGREREGEREQRESEREQRERERQRERRQEEREERGGGSRREREREREQREREPERREGGRGREREGEREQRESEREQRERERQRERRQEGREERGGGRGSGGGGGGGRREYDRRDSEGQYWDCKENCWRQDESQQPECHTSCRRLYEGVAGVGSRDLDQEYRDCEQRCWSQQERQLQPQYLRTCARQYQKRRQEQEQTEQERGGEELISNHHDPRRRFEDCRQQCERQEEGRKQQECTRSCEQQREQEEKEEHRRGSENNQNPNREKTREREAEQEEEEQQQQQDHPYHFRSRRFRYRYKSEQGHMRVLPRFTQRSRLFRGIENFRLAVSELNPSSLVVPHHCDAESILAIINGKTILTLVTQDEKRESYSMERGDLIRIPAGTTIYFINPDNKERLRVVKLIRPVNTPGQFMEYFSAGSENPRSYYRVFSSDILSRSLNTPREQLERLFAGQQRQQGGVARKATAEQIKSLSGHASSRGRKGSKESSQGPINLLNEKPRYQNNHGRFFEASPNDYKQLQHMDVSVAFAELNLGAMMVPHYNSRQTTVILVLEGRGRFEMGCPHVSPRQHRESGERREEIEEEKEEEEGSSVGELHKITADVSAGDVFIAPAGHPFTVVGSKNENFSTLSFGINSLNNKRIFITGKNNIMTQVESEVKEVAFNVPAKLVDKIFNENPKESYFTAGPEQEEEGRQEEEEEERSHSLPSILSLVGFI